LRGFRECSSDGRSEQIDGDQLALGLEDLDDGACPDTSSASIPPVLRMSAAPRKACTAIA
jgi:hypothetical protein